MKYVIFQMLLVRAAISSQISLLFYNSKHIQQMKAKWPVAVCSLIFIRPFRFILRVLILIVHKTLFLKDEFNEEHLIWQELVQAKDRGAMKNVSPCTVQVVKQASVENFPCGKFPNYFETLNQVTHFLIKK